VISDRLKFLFSILYSFYCTNPCFHHEFGERILTLPLLSRWRTCHLIVSDLSLTFLSHGRNAVLKRELLYNPEKKKKFITSSRFFEVLIEKVDQRFAMITMEDDIKKRPHFRLKVDLSKFFYDARRSCWIFVDGMKIQQINHLKQHISKLFNIAEPFHLLLNDTEYLPPIEDVRILKENETILLVLYLVFY